MNVMIMMMNLVMNYAFIFMMIDQGHLMKVNCVNENIKIQNDTGVFVMMNKDVVD